MMKSTLTILSLLFLTNSACAQPAYSAKSLFFGEDDTVITAPTALKKPAADTKAAAAPKPAPKQIGASYFIRLKSRDGSGKDVLASRKFKTGERFQLGVKVNRPAYVYILNEEPGGAVTQIYPPPGQDNYVNAMGTVFFPAQGSFEFDAHPGAEQLLVYLSPTPMSGNVSEHMRALRPDLIAAPRDTACVASQPEVSGYDQAGPTGDYATKGIVLQDAPAGCDGARAAYASKGIVLSDDPAPAKGGQVASYVVKQSADQADKSLYLKIKLMHE